MQLTEDSIELREAMFGSAHFALSRGIAGLGGPAAWLNGLLLKAEEGLAWQQLIPYNLQVEQQRLQVRPAGEPTRAFVPLEGCLAAGSCCCCLCSGMTRRTKCLGRDCKQPIKRQMQA